MSSTTSSSSDADDTSPTKTTKRKVSSSSSSDSDFVDQQKADTTASKKLELPKNKFKHLPNHSTPLQNASTSSKLLFQKMLMGSNNKMAELLKNKQNLAEKNKNPLPVKGILKTSKSPTEKKHKKSNVTELEFDPIASSTQIRENSMTDTPIEKRKKIKRKKKEQISETESSSDDANDKRKHRKESLSKSDLGSKQTNIQNSTSDSSDSEVEISKQKVNAKKATRKLKKVQENPNKSSRKEFNYSKIDQTNSNQSSEDESEESSVEQNVSKNKSRKGQDASKSSTASHSRNDSSGSGSDSSTISHKRSKPSRKGKDASKSSTAIHSRKDSSGSDSSSISHKRSKPHKQKSSSQSEMENENASSTSKKLSSQFKKFESYYKDIQKLDEHLNILENIKSNEEIFIIQIPKTVDPKSLIGTKISLSETTRVPGDTRKYDCIPTCNSQKDAIAIFTNTEKVHLVKPVGNIKIQKHVKSKSIPDLPGTWNNKVAFPENLKQRHPLFGADYSNKISLEEHIQEKLNAAVDSYTKQKKKMKKHKKKKSKTSKEDKSQQEEEIFRFLGQTDSCTKSKEIMEVDTFEHSNSKSKKKKKKKEKHSLDLETEQVEQPPVGKKKNKKHKKHLYDVEESESITAIKQENPEKLKKRKASSDDASQLINQMLLSRTLEISGSKKKRKHSENVTEDDPDTSMGEIKKKKKKHKKEH